ncbi:MAG TPA: ATPase [Clostridiaceae bacterium]|nr:ATPase [Clostridiaceae bacterium]
MSRGKVRHMFAGGNTSLGFYSFFHNILPLNDAQRIFIIKGGPGTGKSHFMEYIAKEMNEKGYDVEYMHCSSDPDSLDGVVLPQIGIALVDGTAPHIVDPKIPGAVDEIINLGDYWNDDGISKHRDKIHAISEEISMTFARAYRYLKAAASIYEDTSVIFDMAQDTGKINTIANDIEKTLMNGIDVSEKEGKQRNMFASAITPDGLKNHLDTVLMNSKVYVLKCEEGRSSERILNRIKKAAIERGLDVECFYCALNPTKLEHIIIPELTVSFTTSNFYHNLDADIYMTLDLNEYADKNILEKYNEVIQYNRKEFDAILQRAVYTLSRAKSLHSELESYYVPNMDFEAVQVCRNVIIERILNYTQ